MKTVRSIKQSAIELHSKLKDHTGNDTHNLPEGFPISRTAYYALGRGEMVISWKAFFEVFNYLGLPEPELLF